MILESEGAYTAGRAALTRALNEGGLDTQSVRWRTHAPRKWSMPQLSAASVLPSHPGTHLKERDTMPRVM